MVIYGVALLAVCVVVGSVLGTALGQLLGIDADVGGVGFAMIMLVFATDWMRRHDLLPKVTEQGIAFWSAIYIPIVIAMASTQNVFGAVSGGPMALLAGVLALLFGAAMVPVLARIGEPADPLPPMTDAEKLEN
ncbi:malonate transporter subunit MadL [Janibacter sp. GS2]|uniref:malonate transporter subunit MadL n=1 Tax=Janibacter sp. GS2 TaxID=3442646 RepID=UPI003EBF3AC0